MRLNSKRHNEIAMSIFFFVAEIVVSNNFNKIDQFCSNYITLLRSRLTIFEYNYDFSDLVLFKFETFGNFEIDFCSHLDHDLKRSSSDEFIIIALKVFGGFD